MCTQEVSFVEHVSVRDLREGLAGYLRRIRAGEALLITDRGAPVARMLPVSGSAPALAALEAEGVVDRGSGKPRGCTRPAQVRGGNVSDLVADMRR